MSHPGCCVLACSDCLTLLQANCTLLQANCAAAAAHLHCFTLQQRVGHENDLVVVQKPAAGHSTPTTTADGNLLSTAVPHGRLCCFSPAHAVDVESPTNLPAVAATTNPYLNSESSSKSFTPATLSSTLSGYM